MNVYLCTEKWQFGYGDRELLVLPELVQQSPLWE